MNSFILHVTIEFLCVSGAQSGTEGLAINKLTVSTQGVGEQGLSLVIATCKSQVRWSHSHNTLLHLQILALHMTTGSPHPEFRKDFKLATSDNDPALAFLSLTAHPPQALVWLSKPVLHNQLLQTLQFSEYRKRRAPHSKEGPAVIPK